MKIIALLMVKNESWILPTYLSSIKPLADEIIAIDDSSTDDSREILLAAGARVFKNEVFLKVGWPEFQTRSKLLELGREHGGTHFICLDADEALSGNFVKIGREKIKALKPGQKLVLHWPFLWKSPYYYVSDKLCEFTGLNKDFIFCDRADFKVFDGFMHLGKTPGPNTPENSIQVSELEGACLHFAYVDFKNALLRQAWYRCSEFVKKPRSYVRINNRYYLPNLGSDFNLTKVPSDWLTGLVLPQNVEQLPPNWRLGNILSLFDEHGVDFFEPLEIWNVKELREEFVKRTGREPASSKMHIYLRPFVMLRRKILGLGKK